MKRKEKHTFYNYQFKHTAVAVTNHPNIQSVDVAAALGIHPIMLYRWRQEMREGKIRDNEQQARSRTELLEAKARIRALERQVKQLREENVILKKAERVFPEKKSPPSASSMSTKDGVR
jgi:transposase